jgi:hypothetical protein
MRNILIAMLGTMALGAVTADAAPRHKQHWRIHAAAPVAVRAAPAPVMNRPAWAGPYECYTDEGYGRFWPCGAGRSN